MLNENAPAYFQTNDFPLISALVCLGFNFSRLDTSNTHRVVFYFPRTQELEKVVGDFWLAKLKVEPKTYWNTLHSLKAQIKEAVEIRKI